MLERPPRGTKDLLPDYYEIFHHVQSTAFDIASLYGFKRVDTPIFEHTELFARTLGDSSDIVSKEMYSFEDKSGNSLTLRPEYTASIVRMLNNAGLWNDLPLRFFAAGPVFRYDRPQRGRHRQFHQINCEILGLSESHADTEIIALAADLLRRIGLLDRLRLEINSLGDKATRQNYRQALLDYLRPYYDDLSADSRVRLSKNPLRILDSKDKKDRHILSDAPKISDFYTSEAQAFFERVQLLLQDLGIQYKINPHLVRGLDYYVHTAFEFISDDLGAQSTVLGGGRYDCSFICNRALDAVGFAAGIERIIELIEYQPKISPFLALVPIGGQAEKRAFSLAHELRNLGFAVFLDYNGNLSKRIKRADKIGAKAVLIFGDDEINNNTYMLKLLQSGHQESIDNTNLVMKLKEILDD
jgi:histidyl-tRNA synthetase